MTARIGLYVCVLSDITLEAAPLQAWIGPEGCRKLRFPDFMTTAHECGKVVSPTHRPDITLTHCGRGF